MKKEIPEPENSSEKEVFAFFGLASYYAQVVEQAVIHFAIVLKSSGKTRITGQDIDSLFERFEKQPMGPLLKEARKLGPIPAELDNQLSSMLQRRNHLIHRFFSEHSEDFMSDAGRSAMIAELRITILQFQETDTALDRIVLPLLAKSGISADMIESAYREMLGRAQSRDGTG
jgi:hypothetical protein